MPPATRADTDLEQRERCALCSVTFRSDISNLSGCGEVAYVDDDVVALIDRNLPGVVVAPRAHVAALATTARPAAVLAALRRAALHVETWYEAADVEITPVTDLSGAVGHVGYHVVPAASDRVALPRDHEPAAEARYLANRLDVTSPPRELHSSR